MDGEFSGYSGQAYSPAGDKGRFVLPPAIRNQVRASSDAKQLYLAPHDRWTCLVGFGKSRTLQFRADLDREEERAIRLGRDFDREKRAMDLNNYSIMPFDDSGRFVMPEHLRSLGNIGDGLYFQGGGDFFTVWNPDELFRMDQSWEPMKAACRSLLGEAQKKGRGK